MNSGKKQVTVFCDVTAMQECFKKWRGEERQIHCRKEIDEFREKCAAPPKSEEN